MRPRGSCSFSQLAFAIGIVAAFSSLGAGAGSGVGSGSGVRAVAGAGKGKLEANGELVAVNGTGRLNTTGRVDCVDCGYTPDAPAPMIRNDDVPRCSEVLCLVQALLDKSMLIYLDQDIDISGSGVLPDITSSVTIMGMCPNGTPCRIDGRGETRIFVVGLNGYLFLRDLEITGAFCDRGSAVTVSASGADDLNKGGKFAALNVMFTNNTATEFGGAIHVESGGALFLRDCVFRSNQATKGGAVYVGSSKDFPGKEPEVRRARPVCALSSCTTFSSAEFIKNTADYGGAVYVDDASPDCSASGGAKFDCTTCAFHKNVAQRDGGAVFVNFDSSGAISYFRKSRFTENSAGEGEYGARGAQLYADQVLFNGSTAGKGSSVAVKPFSISTFSRCEFPSTSALKCEGSCDTFCSTRTPLSNSSATFGPTGESCPMAPAPLCNWFPADCRAPPPPPYETSLSPPPPPEAPAPTSFPGAPVESPAESPFPEAPAESPYPEAPAESPTGEPSPTSGRPSPLRRRNGPRGGSAGGGAPGEAPAEAPLPEAPAESPSGEASGRPWPLRRPRGGAAAAPAPSPSSRRHRNNNGSITGDPHFVGKHGERFDFHGRDGRDYCILSDKSLHINMHVFKGLHKPSTFISMIGMLLRNDRVLVEAHVNKLAPNFEDQWRVTVNKVELKKEQTIETSSGFQITRLSRAVQIRLQNELDLNVTVRPPGLGKYGSGANYLDFQISKIKVSSRIHGVLGQTYQETRATYHKMFEAKARGLKRSRAAAAFMDGSESDYLSTGILAPDCKFSAFVDRSRVSKRVQRIVLEGAQALLGLSEQHRVVSQCTGFGHSLCSEGFEA